MPKAAAQTASCSPPSPKISLCIAMRRESCSSSPITKSNITTPNSAMWVIEPVSVKSAKPDGPMAMPAAR